MEKMSVHFHDKLRHKAVNTDPLRASTTHLGHYGLRVRNIPHTKILNRSDLESLYTFGEKIGQGGFGVVTEICEKISNKKFAVKSVSKSNPNRLKLFQREVQILKLIQHPHIIYLEKVFETPNEIYMVFERCRGDLGKIYLERRPFSEDIAKKIISELVDAVAYLHKYDIVHRDLKMENILVGENPKDSTDEYYIKVTDFGLSVVKFGTGIDSMLHEFCGTLYYLSPEMITLRSYSQQCDMWAVGVILYMLLLGDYPFYASNEKELQKKICSGEPVIQENSISVEAADLIKLLLVKDPVNRIRATEVLQHPWILGNNITKAKQSNILKIMRQWKSEMSMPTGTESDWVASIPVAQVAEKKRPSKQQLLLPKTNIHFNRNRRISNCRESSNPPLKEGKLRMADQKR